ncbi:MAG: PRC-barrel domain-containing protein [Roseovarius sp.]
MKRFLATTAIVALAAAPVMADSHSDKTNEMQNGEQAEMSGNASGKAAETNLTAKVGDKEIHASNMIGHPVYIRSEEAADEKIAKSASQPAESWERVGEIDDIILTADGQIDGVTLDAGGFLGMGEKNVRTGMDELEFVAFDGEENAAESDEFFVVFTGDRSALEDRDEMDENTVRDSGRSFWSDRTEKLQSGETENMQSSNESGRNDGEQQADMSGSDKASDTAADQTAGNESGTDPYGQNDQGADLAELDTAARDALTADELQGLTVYGPEGESIGEISELVVTNDGDITKVVIDVGGFLGLGEKPVAISFDEVSLHEDGSDMMGALRATTEHSSEELEGMREWQG